VRACERGHARRGRTLASRYNRGMSSVSSNSRVVVEPWRGAGPAAAAAALRDRPRLAWLDSSMADGRLGRWSIVASDPRWALTAYGTDVVLEAADGPRRLAPGALHAFARAVEDEPRAVLPDGAPDLPFLGGAIGVFGFELGREVERLPATTRDDVGAPDLAFGWYDAALVWDGAREEGWLVGRVEAVRALRTRLAEGSSTTPRAASAGVLRSNMTRAAYLDAVARARRYIAAGDIYQVNFAQRFSAPYGGSGFDLYRQLRSVSPAPFAAYLDLRGDFGGVEVLSSSPERFLLADQGHAPARRDPRRGHA